MERRVPLERQPTSDAPHVPADAAMSAPIVQDLEKGLERVRTATRGEAGSPAVAAAGARSRGRHKHRREEVEEEIPIPNNNLWIVMPSLGLVAFISALDTSIISTALPTIAAEFGATPSQYSWVATSYLLAQTLMSPINGRVTDIVGRKPALYVSVLFLMVFSALCGSAKNITWLIVARAMTGIGGGSIVSLTLIVISDIVPLNKRGAFQGYMGAAWGAAGSLGPVLGGILTTKASWRWCFYINIPTCGIALALLFFFLNLNPSTGNVAQLRKTFDFLGLLFILTASALLIVGFSTASDSGFATPRAYGVIIGGIVMAIVSIVHFMTTKRNAIIPARVFHTRTPLFFMIGSFLNSFIFMSVNFLLPQFFQGVKGERAYQSGISLIPFSIGAAVFATIAGQITTHLHIVRPVVWAGFAITAIGYGLFYAFLNPDVSYAVQEGIQIIPAGGIGFAISTPMLVLQASMPPKEMAATTSAWVLLRSLGATVGIAVFNAILNAGMRSRFSQIEGYGTVFFFPESVEGYQALQDLPDGPTKTAVLWAFADSFKTCWIVALTLILFALGLTLWTKSYSLERGQASTSSPTSVSADEPLEPIVEDKSLAMTMPVESAPASPPLVERLPSTPPIPSEKRDSSATAVMDNAPSREHDSKQ